MPRAPQLFGSCFENGFRLYGGNRLSRRGCMQSHSRSGGHAWNCLSDWSGLLSKLAASQFGQRFRKIPLARRTRELDRPLRHVWRDVEIVGSAARTLNSHTAGAVTIGSKKFSRKSPAWQPAVLAAQ